ncbi:hypothetical protein [Teredinibacter turnerae]|uniref:hypothetical protein n=1 Tax=Teredinibacter turnerae TaxID=2426 RepID=UPI0003728AD4|nr:hypothetical protein [Teredinibacter turnerae]
MPAVTAIPTGNVATELRVAPPVLELLEELEELEELELLDELEELELLELEELELLELEELELLEELEEVLEVEELLLDELLLELPLFGGGVEESSPPHAARLRIEASSASGTALVFILANML